MPRFALSEPSIGSMTMRVRPLPSSPTSSETIVASTPVEAREDDALGRGVDRGRVVAALALREHRLALGARRQLGEHARARPRPRRGRARASQSKREEEQPARELREEVRRLLRKHLAAARALEHRVDRRRPHEQRRLGVAAVDGRLGLLAARRVRDALGAKALDELDVEAVAFDEPVAVAAVDDDAREARSSGARSRRRRRRPTRCAMRCVGKIVSPSSRVDTSTTIIHADASVPSSSWNASAVS